MKTYKVFSPVSVNGKRYKVGSFVDLTDEQAKNAKGAVIEVPESIKDTIKTSKGKGKKKEEDENETDNETNENNNE